MSQVLDLVHALSLSNRASSEEAGKICRVLLAQTPGNVVYLHLMGVLETKRGNWGEAEKWLVQALEKMPRSAEILCNYGLIFVAQKRFGEALPHFKKAVALKPDYILALYHLAAAYKENGQIFEAIEAYEKLLALSPDYAPALNNLGNIVKDSGRIPEAKGYYEKAIALEPANALYINNLGVIYFMMGALDKATLCHEKALALMPDYPEAYSNLGMIAHNLGAFDKAIAYCEKALALRQDYPEALNNLGNALKDAGRLEESIAAYRKAIALRPQDYEFQHNLSMALLATGNFEEGWALHETRWKTHQLEFSYRDYVQPLWRGEKGEGRTLYIHPEQGFGDTLQFCRYAPIAAERGWRVVLEAPLPLARLMKSLDGVAEVVSSKPRRDSFDVHVPMMSLPGASGTRIDTIPNKQPYLKADAADIACWKERLAPWEAARLKVGLVWSGCARLHSPTLALTNMRRSMKSDYLIPLVESCPDVAFFSLQKAGPSAPQGLPLIDFMDDCSDFADTAALIMNLDLVITVDTAVAHLAGALGKPVWVMNRFDSCWRWQRGSEHTPWYPSMRLFHQSKPGDWQSVVDAVSRTLKRD